MFSLFLLLLRSSGPLLFCLVHLLLHSSLRDSAKGYAFYFSGLCLYYKHTVHGVFWWQEGDNGHNLFLNAAFKAAYNLFREEKYLEQRSKMNDLLL